MFFFSSLLYSSVCVCEYVHVDERVCLRKRICLHEIFVFFFSISFIFNPTTLCPRQQCSNEKYALRFSNPIYGFPINCASDNANDRKIYTNTYKFESLQRPTPDRKRENILNRFAYFAYNTCVHLHFYLVTCVCVFFITSDRLFRIALLIDSITNIFFSLFLCFLVHSFFFKYLSKNEMIEQLKDNAKFIILTLIKLFIQKIEAIHLFAIEINLWLKVKIVTGHSKIYQFLISVLLLRKTKITNILDCNSRESAYFCNN